MQRTIRLVTIALIISGIAGALWLRARSTPRPAATDTLTVAASFYPLFYFAERIGGDFATVTNLTPAGAEPHEYELSPQQVALLEESRLIIVNGGDFEPWATNARENIDADRTVLVAAAAGLNTRQRSEDGHSATDPHVWLSPKLAVVMTERIADGFVAADPQHADTYRTNVATLKMELVALDADFADGLKGCARNDIVTAHDAFGYLAQDYGLTQVAISGLSPDAEPSAKQLAAVASFAEKNKITYIFFESLVSPKLADTIAHEIGAKTLVLDPIEGLTDEAISAGNDYFTVMRANLTNLRTALQCKK